MEFSLLHGEWKLCPLSKIKLNGENFTVLPRCRDLCNAELKELDSILILICFSTVLEFFPHFLSLYHEIKSINFLL